MSFLKLGECGLVGFWGGMRGELGRSERVLRWVLKREGEGEGGERCGRLTW